MYEKEVLVNNPTGLHARPASNLVGLVSKYKSKISILHNGKKINPRSILNVMGAGISKGSTIVISAEGEDEQEAVDALCKFIVELDD
ncbi:MAG: putative phosphocarrier protein [Firmicutes bacterium]|nr:putative phosphocarrier protein [Bacillota bacterium]